ncbi:uncharacterized protein METZ01_LOCUS510915, partial [marine metagenome]
MLEIPRHSLGVSVAPAGKSACSVF